MTVCHANPMLATLDSYVSYSVVSCGQSTYTRRRRNRGGEKAASGYMYGEDSCSEEEEDDGRGNDEDEDKERGEDEKEALSRRHFEMYSRQRRLSIIIDTAVRVLWYLLSRIHVRYDASAAL